MKGWVRFGLATTVLLGLAAGLLGWGVWIYTGLIREETEVERAWAFLEHDYQRRLELTSRLLLRAKYAPELEQESWDEIRQARANAAAMVLSPEILNDVQLFEQFQRCQRELHEELSRLLSRVQEVPTLHANDDVVGLTRLLETTEDRLAAKRQSFNEEAREYDAAIEAFPASFVAGICNLRQKCYFPSPEEQQAALGVISQTSR